VSALSSASTRADCLAFSKIETISYFIGKVRAWGLDRPRASPEAQYAPGPQPLESGNQSGCPKACILCEVLSCHLFRGEPRKNRPGR
jgi:hypothetical protein